MTASKNFLVDSFVAGLALKAPCVAVSNANLTLAGEQTVNGVPVSVNDRVLVIAQTDPIDNGIYNVSTSAWQRADDFDGNRDTVNGTLVTVTSALTTQFYKLTSPNHITIGESALTFQLLGGLDAQSNPTWQTSSDDFEVAAQEQHVIVASTVDIDVTIAAGLLDGNLVALHVAASSGFNAVVAPGAYTIRGPLGTVVDPETLTLSPGETVVLVSNGGTELEIV